MEVGNRKKQKRGPTKMYSSYITGRPLHYGNSISSPHNIMKGQENPQDITMYVYRQRKNILCFTSILTKVHFEIPLSKNVNPLVIMFSRGQEMGMHSGTDDVLLMTSNRSKPV